jgi:hypothetical protein
VPLVGAGLRIEHHDAAVAVAVGHVQLASRQVHAKIGRAAQVGGVVAALGLSAAADLQQEPAVERELQHLCVLVAVAGQPHVVVVVHVDAVFAVWPLVALAGSTPRPHQVAGLVEDQHRRRGATARAVGRRLLRTQLALREASGALHHPHVPALVDGHARHLTQDPVVGERLGPERVHLELREGDWLRQ